MRHLFVMDPLERIHVQGDSTYVVMRTCCERGHEVLMCEPRHLFAREGRAGAMAQPTVVSAIPPHFQTDAAIPVNLADFDVVWMRKDPPFDMDYIFATYLLDMVPPTTVVVNDPVGLKVFNEKLWAMHFRELHPPTLLSRDAKQIRAFVEALPGKAVLKPWDGNGGRGILQTQKGDVNLNSIIEVLTLDGKQAVIAQPFIPEIRQGDKRIMLFDGEPVGALLRVPAQDDFRGNMHVGASVQATELTARDKEICDTLGPALREHGQIWVGIDVIGDWLTEINITSPTGFQEIRRLTGKSLEDELVDRVARHVARRRNTA